MKISGFLVWTFLGAFLANPLAAAPYTVQSVPNTHVQDQSRYVSNPDAVLSVRDEAAINAMLSSLDQDFGIQVAVVALDSIGDHDAWSFANELFNYWGIGDSQDRGLLIQLILDEAQRSITYEVGYGLEGILTDAMTLRLRQIMLPDLRDGNYSAGLLKGVTSTVDYLRANGGGSAAVSGGRAPAEDEPAWPDFLGLLAALAFFVVIPWLSGRPRTCPRCGNKTYACTGREIIRAATARSAGLARKIWHCRTCGYTTHRHVVLPKIQPVVLSGGGGFGGHGGFGGGGSGGGSWGGGRSGGGGGSSRF